jgi:hypothetical protein
MTPEQILAVSGVLTALVGSYFALLKLAGMQFAKRLDEKFAVQEKAREEGRRAWDERARRMEDRQTDLEKEVRRILIELPREYVTRTEYLRRETLIEAKIDQLSLRIENWILKGGNDGR